MGNRIRSSLRSLSSSRNNENFGSNQNLMWVTGFEPAKALSHRILSPTHLTTLAYPHNNDNLIGFLYQTFPLKYRSRLIIKIIKKPCIKRFINRINLEILKTAIVGWKHLFPFRTQKLSFLRW